MIDEMEFTTDWVTPREGWWREIFFGLAGKPLRMLEIGFYEGHSARWWLRHLLTHPESRLVCVDHWAQKGAANRARLFADPVHGRKLAFHAEDAIAYVSRLVAGGAGECYDVVYSDFSKEAADIMTVASLAWRLLRPGGIYLFDDYAWKWTETTTIAAPERDPETGIDAWLAAHEPFCERIERRCGQLLAVKRRPDPTGSNHRANPL